MKLPSIAAFLATAMLIATTGLGQSSADHHTVQNLKITVLSTMLADTLGKGEWGFSALVEVDGRKILFDTGTDSTLVLNNARLFGIDLSAVHTVVLSHSHADHTGGWLVLKTHYPGIDTAFVGNGFFLPRYRSDHSLFYSRSKDSLRHLAEGGHFRVLDGFTEIYPGVYLTGPVPRKYDEKNYPMGTRIMSGDHFTQDSVPEDMSMIFSTAKGLVMLTGCGHSGIINTLDDVQTHLPGKLYAAIGGFHLFAASDEKIGWTAGKLKEAGIQYFVGAHCTGINTVYEIRRLCALKRETCVVGAVGSAFDVNMGISAGWIAQ